MKFNNKKINWDIDVCAMGGITPKNIKKIKLLNITKIGFKRFILEAK
jgi:hypothetical protein